MKVLRAKVLGFCMGVHRAVELAEGEVSRSPEQRCLTIGPLIHNPQVLRSLEERGVGVLDEQNIPEHLKDAAVIIRAHGVSPAVERKLAGRGARIVDATCPKVKASQLKARAFAAAVRRIFLAGEAGHGEIIGIRGYIESVRTVTGCAGKPDIMAAAGAEGPAADGVRGAAPFCVVAGNAAEAEAAAEKLYREEPAAKTALIGQTTISPEEYRAIAAGIQKFFPDLEIAGTICGATRDRQEALRELCGQVEAVIVAGGKESSNTRRLLAIAQARGKPCWLVEGPEDIPREIAAYETVGLCAGASTPGEVIDAIEKALLHCIL
jgi:4-hydroxy-3-methylbut-2-enyl diphosphate reductase